MIKIFLLIIYIIFIFINLFLLKCLAIKELYENFSDLVLSIFFSLFPIVNIFMSFYFTNILISNNINFDVNKLAKKVFFVDWKKKS